MNYAYGDELAIVPYVMNEIVAIAPTHDSPIIFLNSPDYTVSEKFAFIKDYIDGLPFTVAHDDFDEYNMHVLSYQVEAFSRKHHSSKLAVIMREELHLCLSMFPIR